MIILQAILCTQPSFCSRFVRDLRICSRAGGDGQRGQNGPISGGVGDDVDDRKPILQPYGSYGGVVTRSGDVGGPVAASKSATSSSPAAVKSPSRTGRTSTSAQSDDEVSRLALHYTAVSRHKTRAALLSSVAWLCERTHLIQTPVTLYTFIYTSMTVLNIGPKCTLAASHAAPC